jgi:hypothetical protein
MYDLSSGVPDGEFRLLAAMPTGEGVGSATLFAAGVDAMRAADAVRSAEPLDANEHAGVIPFEPPLEERADRGGRPARWWAPRRRENGASGTEGGYSAR